MDLFVQHLQPAIVNNQVFPNVATGFGDTLPAMRENTVKVRRLLLSLLSFYQHCLSENSAQTRYCNCLAQRCIRVLKIAKQLLDWLLVFFKTGMEKVKIVDYVSEDSIAYSI